MHTIIASSNLKSLDPLAIKLCQKRKWLFPRKFNTISFRERAWSMKENIEPQQTSEQYRILKELLDAKVSKHKSILIRGIDKFFQSSLSDMRNFLAQASKNGISVVATAENPSLYMIEEFDKAVLGKTDVDSSIYYDKRKWLSSEQFITIDVKPITLK